MTEEQHDNQVEVLQAKHERQMAVIRVRHAADDLARKVARSLMVRSKCCHENLDGTSSIAAYGEGSSMCEICGERF